MMETQNDNCMEIKTEENLEEIGPPQEQQSLGDDANVSQEKNEENISVLKSEPMDNDENIVEIKSEPMDKDEIILDLKTEPMENKEIDDDDNDDDDDGLLEEDNTNDIEPGELPSVHEGNQDAGDMDVLEAILGGEIKDDFDKEIDASSTTTGKEDANTPKKAPKRKSSRKTKGNKNTESQASSPKTTTTSTPLSTTEPKKVAEEPKEETSLDALQGQAIESEVTQQQSKKTKKVTTDKGKEKLASAAVIPTSEEKENAAKKVPAKTPKKKKTTRKSATNKKASEAKKTEPENTDIPMVEEAEKPAEKSQEEALEKKVKELEKLVKSSPSPKVETPALSQSDGDIKPKIKKEKSQKSSVRKRKGSESTSKDGKVKKGKSKTEIDMVLPKVEDPSENGEASELAAEESAGAGSVDAMRVVDGFSDNESNFSRHSGSFLRSISGSFSGDSFSVTLSSFSGSRASLDSLDKELDDEKPKKKSRRKQPNNDKLAEHKLMIDNILKGARYFIIKSNNYENVSLSKAKGVWATPPANERKLNDAFKHSTNVILVFSVKESGRFQGFARLSSESRHDGIPVPWVLPPGFDRRILGGTFKVDWLNRKEVAFSKCANLRNPWNENKEVKICRDGQELEPSVGEVLCRMFDDDLTIDINRIIRHSRRHKNTSEHPKGLERFDELFRLICAVTPIPWVFYSAIAIIFLVNLFLIYLSASLTLYLQF